MKPMKIPVSEPRLWGNEKKYVLDCIETNWISSMGKYISLFENDFSKYIGVPYATSCSNGTSGLHLALLALNIGPGDEVIVPDFTLIACSNSILYTGAKPVFVDIDPETLCIDPSLIVEKITPKTKAIMVVHMYGHPADMDPILEIAKEHNLRIIEDCCEAHGAEYKGKKVGGIGDIGVFSFYSNKNIVTGEGGMLTSNSKEFIDIAANLKNQSFGPVRFLHDTIGYNYRMTNIQAAIGVAQMEYANEIFEAKRNVIARYKEALANIDCIQLPVEKPWAKSACWMMGVQLLHNSPLSKEEVMKKLMESHGVDTRSFFLPLHSQPAYKDNVLVGNQQATFPVSEEAGAKGFYLPTSFNLTQEDIIYCANALRSVLRQ